MEGGGSRGAGSRPTSRPAGRLGSRDIADALHGGPALGLAWRVRDSSHGHSQGKIVDAISIRERPAGIEDRAIPGHWEGVAARGAQQPRGHAGDVIRVSARGEVCPARTRAMVVAALIQQRRQLPAAARARCHLGPWAGDGPTQKLHDRDGCRVYFPAIRRVPGMRGSKPKHQRPLPGIPAEER